MKSHKFRKLLVPNQDIYLWIIGVLAIVLFKYNIIISIITAIFLVFLIYYNRVTTSRSRENWKKMIENLALDIDAATQNILLDLPFPLLIVKNEGEIVWYNAHFSSICEEENLISMKFSDLLPNLDLKKIREGLEKKKPISYAFEGRTFKVFLNAVENINNEDITMLYWLDITEQEEVKQNYIDQKPLMAYIQIDNFDEILQDASESYRPLISAIIDRKINSWANEFNAFLKKYDTDKYLMIFEKKNLSLMEEKRFHILDIIRETQSGNNMPITLSVGIGHSRQATSFLENQKLSKSALDIALARGGDQVVIKKDEKISYYGGKSQAVEKRTKVKARVKAHGIKGLIQNADKVYIVGHEVPDIDCLGAALGIYRCSKFLEKDAYIILNKSNPSIDVLYDSLLDEGYKDLFVTSEHANKNITNESVTIVVDAHRRSLLEDETILDKTDKIIIIDHHRRGADFIEDAVLIYLEPYASSTCELVAEIVEYMDDDIKLEEIEASALLAGIYMDTKDFSFRTGVRTFEAASYLKRKGADINRCKFLLKDDKDVFVAKIEAVKSAEITKDNIAISVIRNSTDKVKLIVAQAADELLNLQGVDASFALARDGNEVIISGRSLGDVSVQLILEKLGGGGHLSIAGAQLSDVSIMKAKELLKKAIKEYKEEGVNT